MGGTHAARCCALTPTRTDHVEDPPAQPQTLAPDRLMNPLFSTKGLSRLDAIARPGLLCAFDFDGTLAPIVSQPDMARLPADVLDRLVALSSLAPVAIITG